MQIVPAKHATIHDHNVVEPGVTFASCVIFYDKSSSFQRRQVSEILTNELVGIA